MRALVLDAVGALRLETRPDPVPGPGQALVRVGFCGVCGSDIPRIFETGTYRFPLVCGHEFSGTVEAVGADVGSVSPGERVTVFPLLWCGACDACALGRYAQCANYDYLGSRSDGAFAEYVLAPETNLVRLPAGLSLDAGAMTEPSAVALHAVRRAEVGAGDSVAVFGAGPIGLLVAQWAAAAGAGPVMIFDLVPEKLELARGLGFDHVFDPRDVDAPEVVKDATGGAGAAVAVEAAGVPATFLSALSVSGDGGRVVLLGNPSGDVTLPAALVSRAMRRELTLYGTWNSDFSATGDRDDWRDAVAGASAGAIQLDPLITHRVGLEDSIEALEMMRSGREFFEKVLIRL